jgi:hypothetical protein
VQLDGAGAQRHRAARHGAARPDDGDGNQRQAGLQREPEAALLERLERAVARARAFGEEEGRDAAAEEPRRALQAGDGLGRRAAVDGDVAGAPEVPAEEGNQEDLALGRDAQLRGQVAEHDGDVHPALVRREEDVRLARAQMLGAVDAHVEQRRPRNHPAPRARAPVLEPSPPVEGRAGQRERRHHDRVERDERPRHRRVDVIEEGRRARRRGARRVFGRLNRRRLNFRCRGSLRHFL